MWKHIATDVERSMVWSLCALVTPICGWTDRDAVWVQGTMYETGVKSGRTNPFTAARGDRSEMRPLAKLLLGKSTKEMCGMYSDVLLLFSCELWIDRLICTIIDATAKQLFHGVNNTSRQNRWWLVAIIKVHIYSSATTGNNAMTGEISRTSVKLWQQLRHSMHA